MINKFLINTYWTKFKLINDPLEIYMLKNTYGLFKFCITMSFGINYMLYHFLFKGVYEVRNFYFNPKTIPFGLKFGFTTFISIYTAKDIWLNYCYNPEVYELAVECPITYK